ncbi:hypothetical protein JB92DRAFT_2996715 [Gautieria morchelliformis]|nr:hypothetical protein JB92DRAFT_2996715 [Gautieria morchelliformis]
MTFPIYRLVRFRPLFNRRFSSVPPSSPPRPVTLASRPILFISIFGVLHQSLATLSLLPAYGYFHFTDSSTAFLVGPHVAHLLRKPLPFSHGGRTMEDVLDTVMGSYIKTGWRFWSKWNGRKSDEREADEIVKEVLEELEEKRSWRAESYAMKNRLVEMKDRALALKAEPSETIQALKNRLVDIRNGAVAMRDEPPEWMSKMNLNADQLREWKDWVAERLPVFDEVVQPKNGALKAMTDAAAAYLVVKASAPLRIALNIFVTPKVARLLVRRWG